ncbi:beta-lactamase family protein [Maribrevibacterium harenarium]|uniref:Beta-lactamase family protein n=1 Tax=Maribrevibacterium harenarium TaxID=2589817 RepID=A0A501WWC7_9GAMM|nr:serine hydrolase domain-containing protein [Maribrevibacterium harenarium]TPE51261.1 beta-lactamase family protein [Maribrevibacterium harenarium]
MKALLILGALAFLAGCSMAPEKPDRPLKDDYTYLNAYLDWTLEDERRQHDIAAISVMVVDSQNVITKHSSGMADRDRDIPATQDTLYRIGSVTKLFTAISILQLVDQGKMDLDAPLQQYLPQLQLQTPYGASSVTVRQVLTHHAGLPSDMWDGFAENRALDQLIPLVNEQYLSYAPGEVFSYSNVGYALLGLAIEQTSGQAYPDYLQEHIFRPLGPKHSTVGVADQLLAKAYLKLDEQDYPQIRDQAAGDISMSAADLAKFTQVMLRNGEYQNPQGEIKRLISAATFKQMVTPQNGQSPLYQDMPMGLAWFLFYPRPELAGLPVRWHGGATHYFHSSLITLPKQDIAIVVLANSAEAYESVSRIAEQTTRLAFEAKTGQLWPAKTQLDKQPMTLSEEELGRLQGRYISPALGEIHVSVNNKKIVATNEDGKVTLIPYADGTMGVEYKALGALTFDNDFFDQLRLIPMEYQGQLVIKEQNGGVVAQQFPVTPLSSHWQQKLGRYQHQNPDDLYDFSEVTLEDSDGLIRMTLFNEANDYRQILYFNPISSERAINIGLTRSSGDSLIASSTDGDTRLRYLGMEFHRQAQ